MKKTNAVSFGKFGIILEKEQLSYYSEGEIVQVRDVTYEFTLDNLYELAVRIATKQNLLPVVYVNKVDIISRKNG